MLKHWWLFAVPVSLLACSSSPVDAPLAEVTSALNPTTYGVDSNRGQNYDDGTRNGTDVTTTFSPPGTANAPGVPGFCFLTQITGTFENLDSEVDLYPGADGLWHVRALKRKTDPLGPTARFGCRALSSFAGLPGSGVFSERHDIVTTTSDKATEYIDGANKFCPLTGVRGNLRYQFQPTWISHARSQWNAATGKTEFETRRLLGGLPHESVGASTWCIGYPAGFNWKYSLVGADIGYLTPRASTLCAIDKVGNALITPDEAETISTNGVYWILGVTDRYHPASYGATCIPDSQY